MSKIKITDDAQPVWNLEDNTITVSGVTFNIAKIIDSVEQDEVARLEHNAVQMYLDVPEGEIRYGATFLAIPIYKLKKIIFEQDETLTPSQDGNNG